MKKIIIALTAIYFCAFAKTHIMSNIAPASIQYINLEPDFCDIACLNELLESDMLASFMARFEPSVIKDQNLSMMYASLGGNITFVADGSNKIAVIIPQKIIKSYTNVITDAIVSYAAQTNAKIQIEFIFCGDESESSVSSALDQARARNISYFIAPFTKNGFKILKKNLEQKEFAFIPTINVRANGETAPNIVFGGIDYEAQIRVLMSMANDKITAFSDTSYLGNLLNDYTRQSSNGEFYDVQIDSKELNLEEYLNNKTKYNNTSMFLNLPTIKASLIATQARGYEIAPHALLSTQINYTPHIFNSIDEKNRQNLYIANSISEINDELLATTALFGVNLNFNWIAYSSNIGLEYIYTNFIDTAKKRVFHESIQSSQVGYDIKIYEAKGYKFSPVELMEEEIKDNNSSLSL